jgi:hypothetical protein
LSHRQEKKITEYFGTINPQRLGLTDPPEVKSISRLPLGQANLNFLVTTTEGKYVFRMNMEPAADARPVAEYRMS